MILHFCRQIMFNIFLLSLTFLIHRPAFDTLSIQPCPFFLKSTVLELLSVSVCWVKIQSPRFWFIKRYTPHNAYTHTVLTAISTLTWGQPVPLVDNKGCWSKFLTGGMPFLSPNNQCQSTEGLMIIKFLHVIFHTRGIILFSNSKFIFPTILLG